MMHLPKEGSPEIAALLDVLRVIASSLDRDELLGRSLPAIARLVGRPVALLDHAVIGVPLVCEGVSFGHLALGPSLAPGDEPPTWMLETLADALARALAHAERHASVRAAEQRLWEVLDNTNAVVFVKDLAGRYTLVNHRLELDTGLTRAQILGKTDFELFSLETAERLRADDQRVIDSGELLEIEGVTQFPSGPRVFISTKFPLRDRKGRIDGLGGVATDITERKQLEAQLRHSQKLDAVGQLAGGIAHDFNNMLTSISASAELLGMLLPPKPGAGIDEALAHILAASERAAELTRKLIVFSREAHRTAERVEVHAVIEGAVTLLRRDIDHRIRIELELGASAPVVIGEPTRLQAALLDLAVNARDAMTEGGTLTISTRDLALDEAGCRHPTFALRPGSFVEIAVRDTGVGMDADTLEHIFEPFFTTKAVGRGTGLGLAAVHGTVVEHHGAVEVRSRPGQGTSVILRLPTSALVVEKASARAPAPAKSERGVVLLVDDEPLLRTSGARMLERLGCKVVVAADGRDGVARYEEHHDQLRFVLLDMVMPNMGGQAAFEAMRAIDDRVAIIVCSGYAADSAVRSMLDRGLAGFLAKPYRLAQLTELLAKVG